MYKCLFCSRKILYSKRMSILPTLLKQLVGLAPFHTLMSILPSQNPIFKTDVHPPTLLKQLVGLAPFHMLMSILPLAKPHIQNV